MADRDTQDKTFRRIPYISQLRIDYDFNPSSTNISQRPSRGPARHSIHSPARCPSLPPKAPQLLSHPAHLPQPRRRRHRRPSRLPQRRGPTPRPPLFQDPRRLMGDLPRRDAEARPPASVGTCRRPGSVEVQPSAIGTAGGDGWESWSGGGADGEHSGIAGGGLRSPGRG